MLRVGNYWHMLPEYAQAKKSIWDAVNPNTGKRRIDEAFPMAIRKRTNTQTMFIEFINGSTWQLVGSDTYNSLVGSPPVGITASEWALADPAAWAYLRPILRENNGWALFISTFRGRNHFWRMLEEAKNDKDWFSQILTADQTGVFSGESLEKERAELIREYGDDDGDSLFRQEYLCDPDAAIVGAYFAKQISQSRSSGRVTTVAYNDNLNVYSAWDLGMSDSTAIWTFQVSSSEVRVIEYYEASGNTLEHYVRYLNSKPWKYADNFLPHDVSITDISSMGGYSRKETLERLGLRISVVPRVSDKSEAIHAIRSILPRCVFDEVGCKDGLDCLAQYRRVWNEERKVFHDRPFHDWTSHAVDAFDGLARSVEYALSSENKRVKVSPSANYKTRYKSKRFISAMGA